MAKPLQLPTEMMCTDAGLHADEARRHIGEPRLHLAPRPPLPQHDRAAGIKANNVVLPIPQSERDANPKLAQNPGY